MYLDLPEKYKRKKTENYPLGPFDWSYGFSTQF